MMAQSGAMTSTDLIAASSSVLEGGGYKPILVGFPEWNTTSTRLFEDKYNVVGIAVYHNNRRIASLLGGSAGGSR